MCDFPIGWSWAIRVTMLGFSLLVKTGLSWEVARFIGPGVYSLLCFPVGPVTLTLMSLAQKN